VRYSGQLKSSLKVWLKRLAIAAAVAILLWLLLPLVAGLVGISISIIALIGWVILFGGLPFLVWVLAESIYRTFLKAYVRAWHINRIRNARYMKEAAERSGTEE